MLQGNLENYKDLFEKLEHELSLLEKEVTSYSFFNFAVTAWHIKDWIKESDGISKKIKDRLKVFEETEYFKICHDICNHYKHYKITFYTPEVNDIKAQSGYGCGRCGKGLCGIGEESIRITSKSGKNYEGLDFARKVYDEWNAFSKNNGL